MTEHEYQMGELNRILDQNAASHRETLAKAKVLEEQREKFGMNLLAAQQFAKEILSTLEEWGPEEIEEKDPQFLVEIIRRQSELLVKMTDEYVSRTAEDRRFFDLIAEATQGRLELYESEKKLNAEKEALLAKLKIMDGQAEE